MGLFAPPCLSSGRISSSASAGLVGGGVNEREIVVLREGEADCRANLHEFHHAQPLGGPHERALRRLRLFCKEVLPAVRRRILVGRRARESAFPPGERDSRARRPTRIRRRSAKIPMSMLSHLPGYSIRHPVAGPFAGKLLADLGAEVIKLEPPAGDPLAAAAARRGGPRDRDGAPAFFDFLNTNKRVFRLDLGPGPRAAGDFPGLSARADMLRWMRRPVAGVAGSRLSGDRARQSGPYRYVGLGLRQVRPACGLPALHLNRYHAGGNGSSCRRIRNSSDGRRCRARASWGTSKWA